MILGDVVVGVETIAGGTVTGMLVLIMTAFLRRTKDADDRRDEATDALVAHAAEREVRAWAERDRLAQEREVERYEMLERRKELEKRMEEMQWRINSLERENHQLRASG